MRGHLGIHSLPGFWCALQRRKHNQGLNLTICRQAFLSLWDSALGGRAHCMSPKEALGPFPPTYRPGIHEASAVRLFFAKQHWEGFVLIQFLKVQYTAHVCMCIYTCLNLLHSKLLGSKQESASVYMCRH